jgi:hypothetical protein
MISSLPRSPTLLALFLLIAITRDYDAGSGCLLPGASSAGRATSFVGYVQTMVADADERKQDPPIRTDERTIVQDQERPGRIRRSGVLTVT